MKKTFQESELEFFEKISYDRNPLHRDRSYARRTPFGQIVVYGVYAALFGIARWLEGRNVRLSGIKAEFKKPLVLDEIYDLNVSDSEAQTVITFSRSGLIYLKLRIGQPAFAELPFEWPVARAFSPRSSAAGETQYGEDGFLTIPATRYNSGWSDVVAIPPELRFRREQLPFVQLTALLWSTYFVGMEVPGRQALFSSFEFRFDNSVPDTPEFQISPISVEMDRRFNRFIVQGSATGLSSYTLSGFERPGPVDTPLSETRRILGSGKSMVGKRVLITGGSRGFGAVLAQALALQGAQVLINFHKSRKEAEELAESIAPWGPGPILLQGDASRSQDWERLVADVGAIDMLINNASPPIPAIRFKDQCAADFISFVDRSLGMFVETCAHVVPGMNNGGIVVCISSVFVGKPEPGFSHYVAAKAAAESLMHALAAEYSAIRFLVFRAPRMRTDQTNTVTSAEEMATPAEVAKVLLMRLENFTARENFEIAES